MLRHQLYSNTKFAFAYFSPIPFLFNPYRFLIFVVFFSFRKPPVPLETSCDVSCLQIYFSQILEVLDLGMQILPGLASNFASGLVKMLFL